MKGHGYPAGADPNDINYPMTVLLLVILVVYVTMVYGPIAAWLVEMFPTRIRYSGLSLPYHIGNGWFGGFLPATVFAIVAATGNIYSGLWYPIGIAAMSFVVALIFLPETKGSRHHPSRVNGRANTAGRLDEPPRFFCHLVYGEMNRRTIKLRSAAASPHNKAKKNAAAAISRAPAARESGPLHGASSLNTAATAPTTAPHDAARPVFQGEASLCRRITTV